MLIPYYIQIYNNNNEHSINYSFIEENKFNLDVIDGCIEDSDNFREELFHNLIKELVKYSNLNYRENYVMIIEKTFMIEDKKCNLNDFEELSNEAFSLKYFYRDKWNFLQFTDIIPKNEKTNFHHEDINYFNVIRDCNDMCNPDYKLCYEIKLFIKERFIHLYFEEYKRAHFNKK